MIGQLVYALFQQNWDEDVEIGHLAGRQSVGREWEMRQCVWERTKKKKKSIPSKMKVSRMSEAE